ncbi:type II RES/Xre toxin-antitoxin system antitoxin [Oscillatoria salina]|uniref:type II RES/Xre toxin-antitoxin system antitoxin n=1 Tax=Oscillatoria salina TaxID=331517 RepID=UPI0013B9EBD2|nr:antitoxin Xre-like helix-turn-helix domain-containing protein [Oscillatoria salina]MBZ8182378.1 DUF2384 domain-containing protein [Oscillatoria salina IIICB1]NET90153.1 DUF2384 domain-containing protein [Kamptonema sp. SIO1D9]
MSGKDILYEILGIEKIPYSGENQQQSALEMVEIVRQGLQTDAAERVAEYSGLSKVQIATLLGTSERTISRRKKSSKPLDVTESDRLYRLARIIARAIAVFEDSETAKNWLNRPNRALAEATPLELLDTDAGTQKVDELLDKIEYGVYS